MCIRDRPDAPRPARGLAPLSAPPDLARPPRLRCEAPGLRALRGGGSVSVQQGLSRYLQIGTVSTFSHHILTWKGRYLRTTPRAGGVERGAKRSTPSPGRARRRDASSSV